MTREDAIKHLENMKWLKGYSNTTVDVVPIGNVIDGIIALLRAQERDIADIRNDLQDTLAENLRLSNLLQAQEPRLVTIDDFKGADKYGWLPAWCEEQTGGAVYCECILADALKENGVRYWTGKPSDEQREAVKWNG